METISVTVKDVSKRYGDVVANEDINLSFERGAFTTLLGPSGSGKTTLLRVIAGLIEPDTGSVYFDDEDVTDVPPDRRNVGFVFQDLALFPHMSVRDNVAFGLEMNNVPEEEQEKRIAETLELLHIADLRDRNPRELSGGQAQRVALARVLVTDPRILLLDEPLSSLDAKLVDEFRYELRRVQRETEKTAIYVTHDQTTAFIISDEVVLLNQGRVQQVGKPTELYRNPAGTFTTEFIGSANFYEGEVTRVDEARTEVDCGAFSITASSVKSVDVGSEVTVVVRADSIRVLGQRERREDFSNLLEGLLETVVFAGEKSVLRVKTNGEMFQVHVYGEERYHYLDREGEEVTIGFDEAHVM